MSTKADQLECKTYKVVEIARTLTNITRSCCKAQNRMLTQCGSNATFKNRHAENVVVFWPGQSDPTRGVHNHHEEAIEFFKIFPDNHLVNNPYKIFFADGDYTCSVADFTGTFKGPMKGLDGKMIQPTNKKFHAQRRRFFRKGEQEDVRHVSESDPYIVMVSTPNAPDGLFERMEKEPEDICIYKRLFLDYTYGIGKIYKEEIEKARLLRVLSENTTSNT